MGEIYQQLLNEFYRAYQFFNQHFIGGQLPSSIIAIVPMKKGKLGCFHKQWKSVDGSQIGAIYLAAESLKSGCDENLATLLHEMVHQYNDHCGINDCSKNQYHNESFASAAEKFGLIAEKGRRGYSITSLSVTGKEAIKQLQPNRDLWRIFLPLAPEKPKLKTAITVSEETKKKVKQLSNHIGCSMEDVILQGIKSLGVQLDFDFNEDRGELPVTTCSTTEMGIFH